MNRILFVAVVLLLPVLLNAQSRTVSGRLTDETGQPLPQVTVLIKGTTTGTATDSDGYYSIYVPIGSILIYRFLGYSTQEVIVTETGLTPVKGNGAAQSNKLKRQLRKNQRKQQATIFRDSLPSQASGIAILTDESDQHSLLVRPNVNAIKSIKHNKGRHRLRMANTNYYGKALSLGYSTSFGIEHVGKLPELQSRYAQGRASSGLLQWRGPDQNEIISWGPALNTLTYDGSAYPFDRNGRLVAIGNGNAQPAEAYNALALFRTGFNHAHQLKIDFGDYNGNIGFDLEYRNQQGVLPGSDSERFNLSFNVKENLGNYVFLEAKASYNRSNAQLLNRGAQLSTIVGGIYRNPVSFDIFNRFSGESGHYSNTTYQLSDGSNRSHAPAFVDNPVGVIQEFPNQAKNERFLAGLALNVRAGDNLYLKLKTDIDHQTNQSEFGIAPQYTGYRSGVYTNRDLNSSYVFSQLMAEYSTDIDNARLEFKLGTNSQFYEQNLDRLDAFIFTSPVSYPDPSQSVRQVMLPVTLKRNTHEPFISAVYDSWNGLRFGFTNRAYFSITLASDASSLFLPTLEGSINFEDLLYSLSLSELKLYFNAGKTIRETGLLYNNWAYGSLNTAVADYSTFYESNEIVAPAGLLPETEWKFETGLDLELYNNFSMELTYYRNRVDDFIAPVWSQDSPGLANTASIINSGWTASFEYFDSDYPTRWSSSLKLSFPSSTVKSINGNSEFIPLAGFNEVQSVLAPGQDVGTIYGSTFQRDEAGNLVIDFNGFPIKDESLSPIGSPIPDFTMSWHGELNWKQFEFNILIDMSQGGEKWNGTQAMLDFLGRSKTTGDLRELPGQEISGVDLFGNPITTFYPYYNPSFSLSNNRWIRYGPDGVGEEYVQDASWVRLQRLKIGYELPFKNTRWIRSFKLSAIGHNLFLITPYTGSDPTATLFGQANATGLDLFNMPSARSYSLQLSIQIQ